MKKELQDYLDESSRKNPIFTAVESSFERLRSFRKLSTELIAEYAGPSYAEGSKVKEQYINLMMQATDTYVQALSSAPPKIKITAKSPEQKSFAKRFEAATNNLIKEIRLHETIQETVLNAFFCIGVVKNIMAESGIVVEEADVMADPGIPFAQPISIDNFVYDMSATSVGEAKFFGDMYRISYEVMMTSGSYDQDAIADMEVQPSLKKEYVGEDRAEQLSLGHDINPDELEPMVDLADIYIPAEGKIYTYVVVDRDRFRMSGTPIAEMDWTGSEDGPYKILGFSRVPENIMPVAPAMQLSTMSRLVNYLYSKQARQARRSKKYHAYPRHGKDDAKNIQNVADGGMIKVDNAKDIKEVKSGGITPETMAFIAGSIEQFDREAGNLQALAGLGPSSDTAKQDTMINAAASKKESSMAQSVMLFVQSVVIDLAKMLWEDEFKVINDTIRIQGTGGLEVDNTWLPDLREGNFFDYNFDVDVFSANYRTPQQRLSSVNQSVSMFMNMYPMLAEQGGTIDMQEYAATLADMLDEPRIAEIIKFNMAPREADVPQASLSGTHGKPNGEYTRTNVSKGTDHSKAGNWAQMSSGSE